MKIFEANYLKSLLFSSDRNYEYFFVSDEVPTNDWLAVIALEPHIILVATKAQIFDLCHPENYALWVPDDGELKAKQWLKQFTLRITE